MAWDVVISGGGFGASTAGRLRAHDAAPGCAHHAFVNDVISLLYTPFLPEAAAGVLEPRQSSPCCGTCSIRNHLLLGVGARRARAHGDAAGSGGLREQLGPDRLVVAHARSRVLPIWLPTCRSAFQSLADAIWLSNP